MKKFISMKTVLLVACIAALSACNTMQGVGKDLQSSAQGVQEQF